jgi:hypothetical protein
LNSKPFFPFPLVFSPPAAARKKQGIPAIHADLRCNWMNS